MNFCYGISLSSGSSRSQSRNETQDTHESQQTISSSKPATECSERDLQTARYTRKWCWAKRWAISNTDDNRTTSVSQTESEALLRANKEIFAGETQMVVSPSLCRLFPRSSSKQMYVNHKAFNQLCGTSHDSRQPAALLIKSQLTQKKRPRKNLTMTQSAFYVCVGFDVVADAKYSSKL
jgi:hypothetical protein